MWKEEKEVSLLSALFREREHRGIVIYILIFAHCTLGQLFYGLWVNSIVLISNAFLSVFGCLGLCINLISMILSRRRPTSFYSYGFDRIETVGIFSNGSMLLFVALFIFFQSAERLLHDESTHVADVEHHPESDRPEHHQFYHINATIGAALLGLAVNLFGFVFFQKHVHMRSESRNFEKQHFVNAMLKLIITHTFSTAGVAVSSWYSSTYVKVDPIVAICIGFFIIYNAWPLCLDTGRVLLQATPLSIKHEVDRALREITTIEGVLETHDEHFWTQSSGVFVGSFVIRISREADENRILQIASSFFPMITHLTIQVEKDDWTSSDF
eukprot:TRINITY_DN4730_c0_g1_i1.p1 TRINITY_DN4730_c0_g1~~TRINITY_DN4730_c0_g1_i1.p1  ORF type:complete len:334 (+),score=74.86 TRINITY_DN4730_c0_g1_i1:23-1003(+)